MSAKVKIFIVIILLGVVFYPLYPGLWNSWINHSNNSHGILVPIISIYLLWGKRDKLKNIDISSSPWGLFILVFSLVFYMLALAGGIIFISRVMFVFSLVGTVLFIFGGKFFKVCAFPIFFLLFMIPLPVSIVSLISLPLQIFATKISSEVIRTCSIPVLREGNMLYFVQTQLEVAEACSGIRSIVAISMLSSLLVYLFKGRMLYRVILLLSAIPIAVLANILRVSGTGILAHFYGAQVARGFLHEFSGMVVFAFGLAFLLLEATFLNRVFKPGNR